MPYYTFRNVEETFVHQYLAANDFQSFLVTRYFVKLFMNIRSVVFPLSCYHIDQQTDRQVNQRKVKQKLLGGGNTRCSAIAERPPWRVRYSFRQR